MRSNVLDLEKFNAKLRSSGDSRTDVLHPRAGYKLVDLKALGFVPEFGGGEYGYSESGDIVTQTADGRDLNALWNDYQATVAIQNQQRDTLVNFLTFSVTNIIEDVPQFGTVDFELASEFGVPKSARNTMNYFSLAYDFNDYDLAKRFTWQFLRDAPAAQVDQIHNMILEADNRNLFNAVFKTIFNNSNSVTDIRNQAYTVYKFYNNDGTTPPPYAGNTFTSSHNHYITSGAAGIDSGDVDALYEHLRHHGYSVANGTQIVLMVNPAQTPAIRAWRQGATNANSAVATFDFIPAQGQPALIVPNTTGLIGAQVPGTLGGLRVVGSYGDIIIVENDYIPAGYLFMFGTGGEGGLQNPIGLREHANPAYRGLKLYPGGRQGYPLVDSFYSRSFGTGVRQRGGGIVMQITANASYAAPALYA